MRSAFNGTPEYHCLLLFSFGVQLERQSQLNRDTDLERTLQYFCPFDFNESNGIYLFICLDCHLLLLISGVSERRTISENIDRGMADQFHPLVFRLILQIRSELNAYRTLFSVVDL